MNCKQLQRALAENRILTPEEQQHAETCPGCRPMLEAFNSISDPDPGNLGRIQDQLTAQLASVHPRPSVGVLILGSVCLALVLAILGAAIFGHAGYLALSLDERIVYYVALMGAITLLAVTLVQKIIPGSAQRVSPIAASAGPLAAIALVVSLLFHSFGVDHFVKLGFPCFTIGCEVALAVGILAWRLTRSTFTFVASPLQTAITLGSFAGLIGVTVLAIYCPFKNSAHVLVWHLGSMVFAAASAWILCMLWLRRSPRL